MKLKATYIKMGKEVMKGQRWLFLLNLVIAILSYPVFFQMQIIRNTRYGGELPVDYFESLIFESGNLSSSFGRGIIILALLIGIIAGISEFSFVNNKSKVDLFYSLPIKRNGLFTLKTILATLSYIIATAIGILLLLLIASIQGLITLNGSIEFIAMIGLSGLFYLLGFLLAVVAVQLSGKLYVAVLGVGVFLTYGIFLLYLIQYFVATYYPFTIIKGELLNIVGKSSPLYFTTTFRVTAFTDFLWLIFYLLVTVALAYGLVNKRNVEKIGIAIIYKPIRIMIEILLMVMSTFVSAAFFGEIIYNQTPNVILGWEIAGGLIGSIITFVLIQFIYGIQFNKLLGESWKVAIVAGGVILAIICMDVDITNHNEKLPAYEEIQDINIVVQEDYPSEQVYVSENEFANVVSYKTLRIGNLVSNVMQLDTDEASADFSNENMGKSEEIYETLKAVVEENVKVANNKGYNNKDMQVQFVMNDGSIILRQYGLKYVDTIFYDEYGEGISSLWENEAFLNNKYKLRNATADEIFESLTGVQVYLGDVEEGRGHLWSENSSVLDIEESKELIQILIEEYSKADGQILLEQGTVGYATISYNFGTRDYKRLEVPILLSFDKAIAFMKARDGDGFAYAKENIDRIVIDDTIYDSSEEISEIYEHIIFQDTSNLGMELKNWEVGRGGGYAVIDDEKIAFSTLETNSH